MRVLYPIAVLLLMALPGVAAEKPAVQELLEDDAETLIPSLKGGGISGSEDVRAVPEKHDVFSGKSALRVSPAQRFEMDIPGWSYPIVEKPKVGEYRYLRFAWKKLDAGPLMLQLGSRDPASWERRYHAGGSPPWAAIEVAAKAPGEWAVFTRDLFKDFGAFTISGIAFTPLHGGDGLFDHILLGRTIEDLDQATSATLSKSTARPLTDARLKQAWEALGNPDDAVAEAARWSLIAGRKEAMPFLLKNVTIQDRKAPPPVDEAKVKPLIAAFDSYRFVTREAAVEELFRLGEGAIVHVRKAAQSSDGETAIRLNAVLDRWTTRSGLDEVRFRRCVKVLRSIDTPESKELLHKIEAWLP